MSISFHTAKTGMIAQQQGLNIYANNIANVNTVGFKPLRPSFAECIYTLQHPPIQEWQTGHGQYVAKTDLMWEQAGFVFSEQPLDFALPNDGFFMTLDRNGNTMLTRDGRFALSNNGENWELVSGYGEFVLDANGNKIEIPFELDDDGEISTHIDYEALYPRIGIYMVDNNWGLEQTNNNRFVITERSGPAIADLNAEFMPGAYEMSATDLAGDMVRIIETQRSYQLNAKIVQISDEIMKTVNTLR